MLGRLLFLLNLVILTDPSLASSASSGSAGRWRLPLVKKKTDDADEEDEDGDGVHEASAGALASRSRLSVFRREKNPPPVLGVLRRLATRLSAILGGFLEPPPVQP
jgi:hypothetical protein